LVSVTINSIVHPNVSDLRLFLTAPDGSYITLAFNIGGTGDDYYETEFTASALNFAQYGTAPFTGQFLPLDNISTLTGGAQGTWTLKVVDNSAGETGTLLGWSLKLPNYNSIVNYTWSNGAYGVDVNEITPSPSSNTSYTVVALDANGCEGTGGFDVIVNPAPSVGITADNVLCYGESTVLFTEVSFDLSNPINLSSTNATPIIIPDNFPSGVISLIDIEFSNSNASDISSIVINSLTHTYVEDLTIIIIAPDGSSISLVENTGSNGDNFIETEFNMSSPNSITLATAPFTGQFSPLDPFSSLTGSAQGTWTLKVIDSAGGDEGYLNSWSINFQEQNTLTNYAWSSGETGLSYYNLSVVPFESTSYTVTVTDLRGCAGSEMIDVTVNIPSDVVITQGIGTLNSDAVAGNQWYEETIGLLIDETNPILTPLVDGTYYCVVTDVNGCVATSNSINFIYSDISNFNQNAKVSVYPNPNNGIFNLEINSDLDHSMQIQLVSVQGQIVYSSQIEVSSNFSEDFDFSDLAPGIYSLHLMNGDFNKISKIVIQ
jgi:subtilisin-like proprotein convertase family protein